jgi:hypothetical protein
MLHVAVVTFMMGSCACPVTDKWDQVNPTVTEDQKLQFDFSQRPGVELIIISEHNELKQYLSVLCSCSG